MVNTQFPQLIEMLRSEFILACRGVFRLDTTPTEIRVRTSLPRDWALGAVCPVCGNSKITIDPIVAQADRMACAQCACAFEVATDGLHVHLVSGPPKLLESLDRVWYRPAELRDLAVKSMKASNEPAAVETPTDALDRKALWARSQQLSRLGNSVQRIEAILLALKGANPDDVRVVVRELQSRQIKRQQKILRRTAVVALGVVLVAIVVAFFAAQNIITAAVSPQEARPAVVISQQQRSQPLRPGEPDSSASANQSAIEPEHVEKFNLGESIRSFFLGDTASQPNQDANPPTSATVPSVSNNSTGQSSSNSQYLDPSILPDPIRAAIPAGAKVLKPPDIIIEKAESTGTRQRCPTSAGEAVRMFGGDLKTWTQVSAGWTLISMDPVTLYIPDGMTVGYLQYISKPEFFSVPGPVRVHNLNFAAISCE